MSGKKPTHVLSVKEKSGDRRGKVGVAWVDSEGVFVVQLSAGVVLSWSDDLHIRLFPVEKE